MKKKVTKKRVVRKIEAVATRVVKVRGQYGTKYELTKNEIQDFDTRRSWRNSVLFTDLAAILHNLRGLPDETLLDVPGRSGTGPKYMAFSVRHNAEQRSLRIGCQIFTDKSYDRILKAVAKTGLYSV